MRISDWSSDVCSSDLLGHMPGYVAGEPHKVHFDQHAFLVHSEDGNDWTKVQGVRFDLEYDRSKAAPKLSNIEIQENYLNTLKQLGASVLRSEEHTSELQSLMRISYAVFCSQKNKA